MTANDFRYMHRGKQISGLQVGDEHLLESINQRGNKKGRALLLLHGFSSSPAVYRYMIPQFKNYDAIVCPALAGHADSIQAFSMVTAQDWLATATQSCSSLLKEYKKVDVLGLSLGGLLACELSKQFNINHLYLLAPALKLKMNVEFMLKLAKTLYFFGFRYLRNAAGNLLTTQHAEIAYRKLPIATIIEILTLNKNYQWHAPNCPIDLFLGAEDQVVSSNEVESLFAELPNTQVHWLKNSAHVLALDNDLQQIVDCINQH